MKNFKKVLALVLVVATLLSFATVASAITSKDYKDAADIDYTAAVDVLSYIGVLNGYGDGTFKPEGEITRAEAAKIIAMFSNGSTSINTLYASANPFTDVAKGNWAESYIAYCYKTGIVGGVGNGKFAPAANVTGIQFIKMALTVLGYDAKKEGLEGPSWAVNTLALAKRAGLLAGLPANFKYEANLKRQEAAQVMLNALNSNIVDYGYELKSGRRDLQYITTAGAVVVDGVYLKDNWKITTADYTDAFERPGTQYLCNGKTIATYLLPTVKTYTTKISECTLLEDLGVAKTKVGTKVTFDLYNNGANVWEDHELAHKSNNDCVATAVATTSQGTLTEVYDVSNWGSKRDEDYRVVTINTWLAEVTAANSTTSNRYGHTNATPSVTLAVYNPEVPQDRANDNTLIWTANKDGFAKGDMVLVTRSWKHVSATDATELGVQSIVKATAENAQLTGYDRSRDADPKTVEVAGVDKAEAAMFELGYGLIDADSANGYKANIKKTYAFYYDSYGNVIGVSTTAAEAAQYAVIDSAYYAIATGAGYATGSMVTLDAKAADVKIAAADTITGTGAWNAPAKVPYSSFSQYISTEKRNGATVAGNEWAYDHLYTYTADANGNYTFEYVGPSDKYKTVYYVVTNEDNNDIWTASITEGDKNVYLVNNNGSKEAIALNSKTQILIHENDGTYTSATVATVGSLQAGGAHIVDSNKDGYADVVYLFGGIVRKGDVSVGYVVDWTNYQTKVVNGTTYYVYNVYFDGVRTPVYFKTVQDDKTAGLNKFKFALSEDKVVWADATVLTESDGVVTGVELVSVNADKDGMLVSGVAAQKNFAKDVKVYYVDTMTVAGVAHAAVVASSVDELHSGDIMTVAYNGAGQVAAIYVTTCNH